MQMIDVLKRLAELDAQNPNIVKESSQVDECGMMPEIGMPMSPPQPQHPASINMTAGSGEELGDLLTTIMSLAGVAKGNAGLDMPGEPADGAPVGMLEPTTGDSGAPSAADSMHSVIDRLNPSDDEEGGVDDVSKSHGDLDNDGDHDMDDHELEKDKEEVDEYDNTPSNPNDKNEFDADQFAHQENQPGQGDRMDGDRPKAYADMNEAVADLFAQYKKFVSES